MKSLTNEEKIEILLEAQKYMNSKENCGKIKDSMCFSIDRIIDKKYKTNILIIHVNKYIPEFNIGNITSLSEKYNFKKPEPNIKKYEGYWWSTVKKFDRKNRNICFDALITELSK
jgi:hypothetical protein